MHGPRRLAPAIPLCLAMALLPGSGALARTEIEGVRGELRDNVLAHLELDDAPCDAPSWRIRRLVRKAERQVRDALEAYGYYNPSIAIETGSVEDCWVARIAVKPGEPVRLRTVDVRFTGAAQADPVFARLFESPPLRAGAILNHATYERFKDAITDAARLRGYFAGSFATSRIEVHAGQNVADVTLLFDSGPRYLFGPVTFEQDVVKPALVERFVDFRPGEPYDGTVINEFYNALLTTGYFASVDLRTDPGEPPDLEVPVSVTLTAAPRKVYTVGAGYSTDVGPKLRAGYTDRRVSDRGHQFDATASLSQVLSEIGVGYRIPRDDPRVEWLGFDAGFQEKDTDTSESRIAKIGAKEYRRRRGDWIETRFIEASTERSDIAGVSQSQFLLIPGISWSHTEPSNTVVMRPERGHRYTLKVSGTAEYIGSDSEFLQVDAFAKLILPLWRNSRLLVRGEAGTTVKDSFRSLPASVRYFVGGDYSVRGYDYEALGPTDDSGDVVGGSHKLVGSVELDQRVRGNWSAAAFLDTGNAFDDFSNLRTKSAVGAGVRWYSPVGPVRLDLAFPLDRDAPDDWRIHVTLGPDL